MFLHMRANISQFERLAGLGHGGHLVTDVSTFNSAIAPHLIAYDRTRQGVALTDELIAQAGNANHVPPDLMSMLMSARDKYSTELTNGQQKINALLQDGEQLDDFDRSVLAELSSETKADLKPLLTAGQPAQQQIPAVPPTPVAAPAVPEPAAPAA